MYKQLGEMRLMKEQMARQTVNCETALQKAKVRPSFFFLLSSFFEAARMLQMTRK